MKRLDVGDAIRVRLGDVPDPIDGQVWSMGPEPRCGYVVAALDGGRWARVYTSSGRVEEIDSRGVKLDRTGKVAA